MKSSRSRLAWWKRLESRVVAVLLLLGTLCVGASFYLVQLTIAYFDGQMHAAFEEGRGIAEALQPFQDDLVQSRRSEFLARSRALLAEDTSGAPDDLAQQWFRREPDLLAIKWSRNSRGELHRRDPQGKDPQTQIFPLRLQVPDKGEVELFWRVEPTLDARYQQLGERKRSLQLKQGSQPKIHQAVLQITILASAVVLALAVLLGLVLARATMVKVARMTKVIERVGQGDRGARVGRIGEDELGQLATAFDRMLEDLAAAQDKLAYLQKVAAWQEMARRLAHEIKNPLTPIQLAVQQLKDKDPGSDPAYSALLATSTEIVEDEVATLRRMLASFAQFARLPESQLETIDLLHVVEEFERAYKHLGEGEAQLVIEQMPASPVMILGDRQLLKQVLVNLVENAVLSARTSGRVRVEIAVVARPDSRQIELVVQDNGPGVAEEMRTRIFEPYETTRPEGTGLGLAIVKKIVLEHRGSIAVEKSPLGGAAFCIRLPLAPPEAPR